MADLYGALERLKKLLQDRTKKIISRSSTEYEAGGLGDPTRVTRPGQEYLGVQLPVPSGWMKTLEYFPIVGARSGSVVMGVKTGPVKYIYPRVPQMHFVRWMSKNLRGGRIYWYGDQSPPLKDYSIIARKSHRGRIGVSTGRIGQAQIKQRKMKGTGFRYIPVDVRMRALRQAQRRRRK